MGKQGRRQDAQAEVVLDAGAMIAFERGHRWMRGLVAKASEAEIDVVIPTSALAQVWRGGARSASVARLVSAGMIDSLDEARAKEVGERLGRLDGSDIADAHVVCCALDHDAELVTSDPEDMKSLASADEHLVVVPV